MPLTIQTTIGPTPSPVFEDPDTISRLATDHGDVGPNGGTPVAITIPHIRSDQRGLQYDTRNNGGEFRFRTGTLLLTLRQEIHVSNALSPCARTVWLQHEMKHVHDNERAMSQMDARLRANVEFAFILIRPTWQNVSLFASTQQTIQDVVGETFLDLTERAARRQDTRQEYQSVERQIRLRCGHSVGRVLRRGDYGQGIDMVQLALNNHPPTQLAALKVDGVFGMKTEVRVREFQRNNGLEVDGVVGEKTRTALGL
jgi:peptidoglycan hydrolase-like protein with peptidoglycan-binding domain